MMTENNLHSMVTNYLSDGPITQKIFTHFMEMIGEKTDSGGHSVFFGQVRADTINEKIVKAIEYSAYNSMIVIEAEKIKETIFSEFGDVKSIDFIHSTGIVKAGEISLLVLVSAGHRNQAIQACSKTVDLIKEKLPIWKKEIFDDNSHKWK